MATSHGNSRPGPLPTFPVVNGENCVCGPHTGRAPGASCVRIDARTSGYVALGGRFCDVVDAAPPPGEARNATHWSRTLSAMALSSVASIGALGIVLCRHCKTWEMLSTLPTVPLMAVRTQVMAIPNSCSTACAGGARGNGTAQLVLPAGGSLMASLRMIRSIASLVPWATPGAVWRLTSDSHEKTQCVPGGPNRLSSAYE